MDLLRLRAFLLPLTVLLLAIVGVGHGQSLAPAPAPASSDGNAIDQGIAYVLLFVALLLTYFLH
ncbi:Arabinogalactan peptide 22 [Nymphaea thermarum]|nr:Arabinogalactan peptide 22 [Nymphaea thermarum]